MCLPVVNNGNVIPIDLWRRYTFWYQKGVPRLTRGISEHFQISYRRMWDVGHSDVRFAFLSFVLGVNDLDGASPWAAQAHSCCDFSPPGVLGPCWKSWIATAPFSMTR